MSAAEAPARPRGLKLALFSAVTVAAVLGALELLTRALERRELVSTERGIDDRVQFVPDRFFERGEDGVYHNSARGLDSMVPTRFRLDDDVFRVVVVGGSFAMGTPYVMQGCGFEAPGGVSTWLRALLQPRFEQRVEVINAAAGAVDSYFVAKVVDEVVRYQPDLLVIATGNNEGNWSPSRAVRTLRGLALFRLLSKWIHPPPARRSEFTAQRMAPEELREYYRQNVRAMLEASERAGVPTVLAVLPINLRWRSDAAPAQGDPPPCVEAGLETLARAGPLAALTPLEPCDDATLKTWAQRLERDGQLERAAALYAALVERNPQNRIRPTLQEIAREEAARASHVVLADLDARARAISEGGVPGDDLFVDSCHMTWQGYAEMAEALVEAAEDADLVPASEQAFDPASLARELGLQTRRDDVAAVRGELELGDPRTAEDGSVVVPVRGWVDGDAPACIPRVVLRQPGQLDGRVLKNFLFDQPRPDICGQRSHGVMCRNVAARVGFAGDVVLPETLSGAADLELQVSRWSQPVVVTTAPLPTR